MREKKNTQNDSFGSKTRKRITKQVIPIAPSLLEREKVSHVQFVVLVEFCGSKNERKSARGVIRNRLEKKATVKSVDRLATCMAFFIFFFTMTMKQ